MRIGLDIRALQGAQQNRGVGRYIKQLLKGLIAQKKGHELVLFARDNRSLPIEAEGQTVISVATPPLSPHERYFRFAVGRRWYHDSLQAKHRAALRTAVRQARLDLLHLPSLIEPDYFSDAGDVCPVVSTLHDLIPLILAKDYLENWMQAAREVYVRQLDLFRQSGNVVAISRSTRNDAIKHLQLDPERIAVIYCGISAEGCRRWCSTQQQTVVRQKYGMETPYFIYCSGSGPNKNLERTIEAHTRYVREHNHPFPLVIAGKWRESDRLRLEQSGSGAQTLRFLGFVPDEELWTLVAAATALISVSLYEGFGLPPAEAMAVGTPVLTGNTSSYPEVVGDAGILVPPDNVEAIAAGFAQLTGNGDLCAELGARGRARFEQYFTLEQQTQAYLSLYEQAAAKPATPGTKKP